MKRAMNCLSFKESRKWARKQGFWLERQHKDLAEKNLIPKNIPNYPDTYFKRRGEWTSWADYLNSKKHSPIPNFKKARQIVRRYNLQTQAEFLRWQKKYGKKYFIVNNPAKQFKGEYKGMTDYLGIKPKYVSFTKAKKITKEIMKTTKITCRREYWNYIKENPQYKIPTSPDSYYKNQWKSWGDYLGTGYVTLTQRKNGYYLSFKEFKKFVKKFNFKGQREWEQWNRTHKRPKKIPMAIAKVYEKEWKGWADALGYKPKQRFYEEHWDYKKASAWAKSKKLKSGSDFKRKAKTKTWLPKQIVIDVEDHFRKRNQWKSWSHFLGLPRNRKANRKFRSYEEAKKWTEKHNIKTYEQWIKSKKPFDVPYSPSKTYEGKGWVSWMEFFNRKPLMEFDEARAYARSLKVKTIQEVYRLKDEGKIDERFPYSFWNKYHTDPKWISLPDFLGTPVKNTHYRTWKSYDEVVEYIKNMNFTGQGSYVKWCKTEQRPADIPASPDRVYKKTGDWRGWTHFLSNKPRKIHDRTIYPRPKEYWKYEKAKTFVNKLKLKSQAEWHEFVRSGKKPIQIPSSPQNVYSKNKRRS